LSWDEKQTDLDDHPFWCYCSFCRGDIETPDENEVLNAIADFIEKTTANITRTVLQTYRKENHSMLQRTNAPAAAKGSGLPYLKIENLTTDKQRAKILWAGDPKELGGNRFNNIVVLKLEFKVSGRKYLWGLKNENPNLDTLCAGMTEDENTWTDREIDLFLEVKKIDEKKYVRCEVVPVVG